MGNAMKTIETERLLLRPPVGDDLPPWRAMLSDPEASKFIGGVQSENGAWRNLALMAGSWTVNGYGNFSVIEKVSARWIGRAGPWMPPGWPGPEVGWAFDRAAWGKGYATEAAIACMDYVFDDLGWSNVTHVIAPANEASIKLALRLGSSRRGPGQLPPPSEKIVVDLYGQSRETWCSRSR
jgi:RimJ/RimL family protein N-acetyltransferase